jgi:hypothetical protein
MSHPPGLVAKVYPKYFNSAAFGSLTNCFTFMVGFDDMFMEFLGVKVLRPEDLEWTKLQTKEEWISAVTAYFKPELPELQPGSTANRFGTCFPDLDQTHSYPEQAMPYISSSILCEPTGLYWTPPSVPALCFPLIQGARDYHWAVYNGTYWLEQAGRAGPINVWASLDGLVEDVYKRGDHDGKYYVEGSHFFFSKRIA